MSNHRKQKLKSVLSKGILHFVIVRGVLFWGGLTATIISAINYFYHNKPIAESISSNFIIYPIAGIFFGLLLWFVFNNQYNKLRDDEI